MPADRVLNGGYYGLIATLDCHSRIKWSDGSAWTREAMQAPHDSWIDRVEEQMLQLAKPIRQRHVQITQCENGCINDDQGGTQASVQKGKERPEDALVAGDVQQTAAQEGVAPDEVLDSTRSALNLAWSPF